MAYAPSFTIQLSSDWAGPANRKPRVSPQIAFILEKIIALIGSCMTVAALVYKPHPVACRIAIGSCFGGPWHAQVRKTCAHKPKSKFNMVSKKVSSLLKTSLCTPLCCQLVCETGDSNDINMRAYRREKCSLTLARPDRAQKVRQRTGTTRLKELFKLG